jgi:hypothetical protein
MLEVEIGAFAIDKLPHPNDPTAPPTTGVTRERATQLCAEHGGRLCNELEWERACKGPEGQTFAGGDAWDAACARAPETCASGFGVLAMGAAQREWTASDVDEIAEIVPRGAAVRGVRGDAADVDHRCAHRSVVAPDSTAADLGFRCCYGEASAAKIPSQAMEPNVRRVEMPPSRVAELFAANKRLEPLAGDIKYFREEAAVDTVLRRGRARGADADAPPYGFELTTQPIVWSPVPGERILVVTGQSGKDSFIVAFHELPGGRYRVGATFHMKDELGPVVIAFSQNVRKKLEWATCWDCGGESGNVTYRPDYRVVITQK